MKLRPLFQHPAFPIIGLVLVNLLVAAFVFDDYGESWDENSIFIYAENTLDAYKLGLSGASINRELLEPFNLRFYGPAYFAFSRVFASLGVSLFPRIGEIHFWHLSYFVSFQVALVSLYFICLRFISVWPSLGAVALFNTQPLLWGHAFINPKDIPFLGFFLLSLCAGLWMVDRVGDAKPKSRKVSRFSLKRAWTGIPKAVQKQLMISASLCALLAIVVFLIPLSDLVQDWARAAYSQPASSWSFWILTTFAPGLGTISLESYLAKFSRLVPTIKVVVVIAILGAFLAYTLFRLPDGRKKLIVWVQSFFECYWPSAVAGIVLGFTTAMRVIAPLAGLLVLVYLLLRRRPDWFGTILVYFIAAGLVAFALWPFLWGDPVSSLATSLNEMANFPKDIGVLFNGQDLRSTNLPALYLPTLLAVQLTKPVLFLFVAGVFFSIIRFRKGKMDGTLPLLIGVWVLAPVLFIVATRPTLYDNFRQFLFLLPPLFIFGALAIDEIYKRAKPVVFGALILLLLAPGVMANIKLHPYEYVYYNAYVGDVGGAEGRYELDYWATSYREAIEYLNRVAPGNSGVYLDGPDHMMRRFGRPDLIAVYEALSQQSDLSVYDFAILTTRFDTDSRLFADSEIVYVVERDGAIFAVVKRILQP